uniref:Uncharacterized protein n=1 Tax=Terrapene triunguis TaxID=2587831 RepID=A0A674IFD7_9SAUR
MHDHQQGGAGDQDELQGPEADVGDGEEVVITDVGAAGLARVALKVPLVVAPHPLSRHYVDQEAEDDDHGEPDLLEPGPIHPLVWGYDSSCIPGI